MAKKKNRKNWIWLAVVAIAYFLYDFLKGGSTVSNAVEAVKAVSKPKSNRNRKANIMSKYPTAKSVLTDLQVYNNMVRQSWDKGIQSHINWTRKNRTASHPRYKYFESINWNPRMATQHAKLLGVI